MNKNLLALFFTLLFTVLITAPTLLVFADNTIDVSLLYDISEEEEEKGNEKNKELEVVVIALQPELLEALLQERKLCLEDIFKLYSKPHLNLISPPPERV